MLAATPLRGLRLARARDENGLVITVMASASKAIVVLVYLAAGRFAFSITGAVIAIGADRRGGLRSDGTGVHGCGVGGLFEWVLLKQAPGYNHARRSHHRNFSSCCVLP